MKYTKESLNRESVHILREIGRDVGVKAPSSLTKSELIEKILSIQSGATKPYFSKFGRPSLDGKINTRKIKTENDDRLLEEIEKILQDTRKKIQKLFK